LPDQARLEGLGEPRLSELPSHDPAEVEASLERDLRRHVERVASWVPTRWQAAVLETRSLIDRGPLLEGADDSEEMASWRARWRRRWPAMPADHVRALVELERACEAHGRTLEHADADADSWALRRTLERTLTGMFRRGAGEPVAVFAYLALVGLDFERLRGAVLRRLALPRIRSAVAWV
jgi:hypothetical protein